MDIENDDKFVFDEKKHAYFYDGKPMMGCTSVLGVLAKPALIPWAAKMAVEHVRSELKATDKWNWTKEIDRILEEAKGAHARKRDDAAEKGTDLHALVEQWVSSCIALHDGQPNAMWPEEIDAFGRWAQKEKVRFIASEQKLFSKSLWVAGTVDLVFEKDGKHFIGDIKTYKKIWDKVPLIQCAGYALMAEEMKLYLHAVEDSTVAYGFDGYCVICLPKERAFKEEDEVLWSFDPQTEKEAFIGAVRLYKYLTQ